MFDKFKVVIFISFLICITACSSKTNLKENSFNYNAQELAREIQGLKESSDYLLQPGDLVDIQVYKEEDMSRTLRISIFTYIV